MLDGLGWWELAYTHLLVSLRRGRETYIVSFFFWCLGTILANQEAVALHGDFLNKGRLKLEIVTTIRQFFLIINAFHIIISKRNICISSNNYIILSKCRSNSLYSPSQKILMPFNIEMVKRFGVLDITLMFACTHTYSTIYYGNDHPLKCLFFISLQVVWKLWYVGKWL